MIIFRKAQIVILAIAAFSSTSIGECAELQDSQTILSKSFAQGEYSKTARLATTIANQNHADWIAAYWAGLSYFRTGDEDKAVIWLWYVTKYFPLKAEAYSARLMLKKYDPNYYKHATSTSFAPTPFLSTNKPVRKLSQQELSLGLLVRVRSKGDRPEISQAFVDCVTDTLEKLPRGLLELLYAAGSKVQVTPMVIDADMRIQNEHPGGYQEGQSAKNARARFDGKDVIIAEYYYDENNELQKNSDTAGCLRHEIGHAIDVDAGNISATEEYKHVYWIQWTMPAEDRPILQYYRRPGRAGPAETFAELFCSKYGGRNLERDQSVAELLQRRFSGCREILDREVARFVAN